MKVFLIPFMSGPSAFALNTKENTPAPHICLTTTALFMLFAHVFWSYTINREVGEKYNTKFLNIYKISLVPHS